MPRSCAGRAQRRRPSLSTALLAMGPEGSADADSAPALFSYVSGATAASIASCSGLPDAGDGVTRRLRGLPLTAAARRAGFEASVLASARSTMRAASSTKRSSRSSTSTAVIYSRRFDHLEPTRVRAACDPTSQAGRRPVAQRGKKEEPPGNRRFPASGSARSAAANIRSWSLGSAIRSSRRFSSSRRSRRRGRALRAR